MKLSRRDTISGAIATAMASIAVRDELPTDAVRHRTQKGFASILDVASYAGEPSGVGISFADPFGNYGPKTLTFIIISEYNVSNISFTPPTPYGARFTVTAAEPGEFECSVVWTAEG